MDPRDLRRTIGLVPQDTFLFHETVAGNLRLTRPAATDDDLGDALGSAGAVGVRRGAARGLDTVVGERGFRLSGGERQRIAIARALLKDAPILILDEATSNVDVASEVGIQDSIDELRRGRTTVIIAHRLSTVRGADRILVLDHGRLAEAGTHEELLARWRPVRAARRGAGAGRMSAVATPAPSAQSGSGATTRAEPPAGRGAARARTGPCSPAGWRRT